MVTEDSRFGMDMPLSHEPKSKTRVKP